MSIACDANSLIANAACLECGIPPGMQLSVLISLFCKVAGANCDPATLVANAACLECAIPPGFQLAVLNYLACQIVNNAGVSKFASGNVTIDNTTTRYAVNHNLGATPAQVRAVLVAIHVDANWGFPVGDEIAVDAVFNAAPGNAFIVGANSTQVYLEASIPNGQPTALIGNEGFFTLVSNPTSAGAGAKALSSFTNYAIKFYAWF